MSGTETATTDGAAGTEALGARVAAELRAGDVVVVRGEMGAGKTTFVRGALRALGVTGPVTSPTFTLGRRYEDVRPPVSHLDLHRLATLDDEDPALLDDYINSDHIAFVEWPEVALPELAPEIRVTVELAHGGRDTRHVTISWT